MGSSKSYRGGPASGSRNTPRGRTKASTGAVVHAEGTHTSGGGYGRKGMPSSARNKSKSGKMSSRNPGPHGYS